MYMCTYIQTYTLCTASICSKHFFKSIDCGTDFKWSIYRGSRFREFEYRYNGIAYVSVLSNRLYVL